MPWLEQHEAGTADEQSYRLFLVRKWRENVKKRQFDEILPDCFGQISNENL
jgi:hypothetical protein